MKNIVFDLGGVLFARDKSKCSPEIVEFFGFLRAPQMPRFWEEYDRGASSIGEVTDTLCTLTGRPRAVCERVLREAIDLQGSPLRRPSASSASSNGRDTASTCFRTCRASSLTACAASRSMPFFDGEVVSCEEGTVKPEPRIYEILLGRYGLDPAETLFIDDRPANVAAAEALGIRGFGFDHRDPAAACDALRRMLL